MSEVNRTVSFPTPTELEGEQQLVHLEVLFHVLLKPSLKDFEHNLAGMLNECICAVV